MSRDVITEWILYASKFSENRCVPVEQPRFSLYLLVILIHPLCRGSNVGKKLFNCTVPSPIH
jgi:hypothetical protein